MRPRQRRDRPAAGGVKVVHLEAFLPSQGGVGIYSVELYLQVRLACADGMSQRAAAKRSNVSRETVRKMLSFSSPPGYRRQSVPQRPKLDGFVAIIDGWLEGDRSVPRKQRHTAKRVFDRLRTEHGFTGGDRKSTR